MPYGIKLEVWGDLAAFNRPEMKVERVSYEIMTPSAARGILEAIYWKPEMQWQVDQLHVLRPVRFTHVRRNEIQSKISIRGKSGVQAAMNSGKGSLGVAVESQRQQRAAMVLRDVRYGIAAHVEVLSHEDTSSGEGPSAAKHIEMFKRRASRGQYFHHPYLGCREFPASFKLVDAFSPTPEALTGDSDLGYMLHDIDFVEDPAGQVVESSEGRRVTPEPHFFHARLRDGVVDVPRFQRRGVQQ